MKKAHRLCTAQAFTLLELLLVIAIIASLAGLIINALNPAQRLQEANDVKALTNAEDIKKALQAYILDNNGQYPAQLQTMINNGAKTISICKEGEDCVGTGLEELVNGGYLPSIPINAGYDTLDKSGYDVMVTGNNLNVVGPATTPVFLLRDDFTTTASAPLTSPRTAEPGPGTFVVEQLNGAIYQIDQDILKLSGQISNGWDQNGFYKNDMIQLNPGMLYIGKFYAPGYVGSTALGFGHSNGDTTYFLHPGIYPLGNPNLYVNGSSSIPLNIAITTGNWYEIGLVFMGNSRIAAVVRGGMYPNWTLAGIKPFAIPVIRRPGFSQYTNQQLWVDYVRLTSINSPWKENYGIATQNLIGDVVVGTTFSHEADFVMEWTQTNLPASGGTQIRFRKQDALNYWYFTVWPGGDMTLYEYVAGAATSRGYHTGPITNGTKIVLIADGTTIRIYSGDALRITYNSANNFQTASSGDLGTLGSSGVVSDIVIYPRTLTGSAAAALDKAIE